MYQRKARIQFALNGKTTELTEEELQNLSALVICPDRGSTALCMKKCVATIHECTTTSKYGPKLLEILNTRTVHGLKMALAFEDPAFRMELREYGKQLAKPDIEEIRLTPRELKIADTLFTSFSAEQIADRLFIVPKTFDGNFQNLRLKLLGEGERANRTKLCAILLNMGYPSGIGEDTIITLEDYERILIERFASERFHLV